MSDFDVFTDPMLCDEPARYVDRHGVFYAITRRANYMWCVIRTKRPERRESWQPVALRELAQQTTRTEMERRLRLYALRHGLSPAAGQEFNMPPMDANI